ncbi:dethiobiotin synthase [Leptothrix sp. BB-4]
MKAYFVTGTDTEIGKTAVTAGLTCLAAGFGLRSLAIKPVSAGQDFVADRWVNEDVLRLRSASSVPLSDAQAGPMQWRMPCAPHIAATLEGKTIDRVSLLADVRQTLNLADVAFVEGVGGFQVPLTDTWDTADLAVNLGFPVILVVGLRLGCLNHALLTAAALRSRGLHLAAWVANTVDPVMRHVEENLAALSVRLKADCWGQVPRLPEPDPAAVAAHLNRDLLRQALETT